MRKHQHDIRDSAFPDSNQFDEGKKWMNSEEVEYWVLAILFNYSIGSA